MTGLSLRSRGVETDDEIRGPIGLNLLYEPAEPIVDLIFVHGLGGGSRKTWSKSPDVDSFWPQEWLPRDVEFKHTRVHSFGYNSNWTEKGQSVLNMIDFAKSLLGAMKDCPHLRKTPQVGDATTVHQTLLGLIKYIESYHFCWPQHGRTRD